MENRGSGFHRRSEKSDDVLSIVIKQESDNRPVAVLRAELDEAECDEVVRLLNRGLRFEELLSFLRDDLCDLGEAVGADRWIEKRRRALVAAMEALE